VALDVGQGDAVALGFGDGWWLVDAGPRSPRGDAGEAVVLPFLRWAAVRRLGALALTHDDGDHVGGAPAVRRGLPVEGVVVPPRFPGRPGPGARFEGREAARGDTLRHTPAIVVRWPPRRAAPPSDNAASLVLEIGEGAGRALLAADVDSTVEDSLAVASGVALLKVAHHGSGSSSGARFARRLRAGDALISCGRNSPFGHPHAGALARLAAAGSRVHRTDRDGALWFEVSAAGARRVDWRRGIPRSAAGEDARAGPAPGAGAAARGTLARPSPHW
jgi:competence protein ComEC